MSDSLCRRPTDLTCEQSCDLETAKLFFISKWNYFGSVFLLQLWFLLPTHPTETPTTPQKQVGRDLEASGGHRRRSTTIKVKKILLVVPFHEKKFLFTK